MSIFDNNLKNTYVEGCLKELQKQIDDIKLKSVMTIPQILTDIQKSNARTNIGATGIVYNSEFLNKCSFLGGTSIDITFASDTFTISLASSVQNDIDSRAKADASNLTNDNVTSWKTELNIDTIESTLATKLSNPMTSEGDLIVGGASGTPTRLSIGNAGEFLKVNALGTGFEFGNAGGGIDSMVVWTNANPTSQFTNVNVDITIPSVSGYSYMLVIASEYYNAVTYRQFVSSIGEIDTSHQFGCRLFAVGDYGRMFRSVFITADTTMAIGPCYKCLPGQSTSTTVNTHLIPQKVIVFNL